MATFTLFSHMDGYCAFTDRMVRQFVWKLQKIFDFQDGGSRHLDISETKHLTLFLHDSLVRRLLKKFPEGGSISSEIIADFRFSIWRLLPSCILEKAPFTQHESCC